MNPKDLLILSTNPYLILIAKWMADAWPLKTIPAIQSSLAKSALRKRPFITIPYQGNPFLCSF
jgi:hypothetical protein